MCPRPPEELTLRNGRANVKETYAASRAVCPPCKSARAPLGPNHAVPGHTTTTVIDANSATRQVSLRIGKERHAAMRSYRNPSDGANLPQASFFLLFTSKPRRSHSAPLGAASGPVPIGVRGATVGGRGVRVLHLLLGPMPIGVDFATVGVGGATVGGRGIRRRGATVGGPCAPSSLSASAVPPSREG